MTLSPDPDHGELSGLVQPPGNPPSTADAARSLARILAVLPWRLASHAERWPSHGYGCPCGMDAVRQLRSAARDLERSGTFGRQAVRHLRFVLDSALSPPPGEEDR